MAKSTRASKSKSRTSSEISSDDEHMIIHGQNPKNLTGNGTQYVMKESVPKFDDKSENWPKYAAEFELHISAQNEEDDIRNTSFSPRRNKEIYAMLIKGIGRRSFEIVHRILKNQGKEAFLYLEDYYIGNIQHRKLKILHELTLTKLKDSDSIRDFAIKLLHWEADCISHNLLPAPKEPGEPSILVSLALKALPPRMENFASRCREREGGPPSVNQLSEMIIEEDHQQSLSLSRNASHNIVSAATTSRNELQKKNQGFKRKKNFNMRNNSQNTLQPVRDFNNYNRNDRQGARQEDRNQDPPSKRRITCSKCKSTNGHTSDTCWSKNWCTNCRSTSHNTKVCRKTKTSTK